MGKANTISDLKARQREKDDRCSFCGSHKDDVPLLVRSNTTGAAICSNCAITVVNQTFSFAMQISEKNRELIGERHALASKLDAVLGDKGGQLPDTKQDAIDAANEADVSD